MRTAALFCCVIISLASLFGQTPGQPPTDLDLGALRARAETGDPVAEFQLGKAYSSGQGVTRNDATAAKWIRRAAEHGSVPAFNELGVMYRTGNGVDRDFEEAVRWFRKGAKAGDGKARFNLASCYYNGEGVGTSDPRAFAWFVMARDAGETGAEDGIRRISLSMSNSLKTVAYMDVAEIYRKGEEVERDYARAYEWYSKAAELDVPEAELKAAALQFDGLGVAKNPLAARDTMEKLAKKGYKPAMLSLGRLYEAGGGGLPRDIKMAQKWYLEAAEHGDQRAMAIVGRMLHSGEGGISDDVEACSWLLLAKSYGEKSVDADLNTILLTLSKKQKQQVDKKMKAWQSKTYRPVLMLPPEAK